MKQIILFILFCFPIYLFANPIWLGVNISEIYFNEAGEWTLEIDNCSDFSSIDILDSIMIESLSGIATIVSFDTTDFIVVTNENLSTSISLNKNEDHIKLHSFFLGQYQTDSVAIGNYQGSYLKDIQNGQSIARQLGPYPFYKDNTPTIGTENDFNGAIGKIYGHFYDSLGITITNKYFFINEGYCTPILQKQGTPEGCIRINEEGFYCAEITSRSYSINEFSIYQERTNADPIIELIQFQPVSFEVNENDSINVDFNALTSSISAKKESIVLLSNYPNPASDYTYFIFNPEILNKSDATITVFDIKGNSLAAFNPNTQCNKWDCSMLSKGTYLYSLSINNQIVASQKLQIVK